MHPARGFTLRELAARASKAADYELFGVNLLELEAARGNDNAAATLAETRRQAEALGKVAQIVAALARNPALNLGGDEAALAALAATLDGDA